MKSKPPVLKGLYRIGDDFAWKVTSPQDHEHEYVFSARTSKRRRSALNCSPTMGSVRACGSWDRCDHGYRNVYMPGGVCLQSPPEVDVCSLNPTQVCSWDMRFNRRRVPKRRRCIKIEEDV